MKIKISQTAIEELANIIANLTMKYKEVELDYILLKLAMFPFYTDETKQRKDELLKKINSIYFDNPRMVEEFNQKYLEWIRKYYPEYEKDIYKVEEFEEEEEMGIDDDFFDFDSEEVDYSINDMHYLDADKLSASEFMQDIGIEEDIILDIQELLKELKEIIEFHITLDEEYIEKFSLAIKKLIYVLELSVDFKDLAKALNNLLDLINIQNLDENQKKLLKQFLDTIYFDLEKWVDEVLINQTAVDIHYLDAALLANIAQIEIILKGN